METAVGERFTSEEVWLQWSHVLTNVETLRGYLRENKNKYVLQWSHVLTNVETCITLSPSSAYLWLQWSHVLTNVETVRAALTGNLDVAASMEPRPHERGNAVLERNGRRWRLASMEPRPHERGNMKFASGLWSASASFNGATSSRTWKPEPEHGCARGAEAASMEPRPHERGNPDAPAMARAAFAASMEPRPHERGNAPADERAGGVEDLLQWSHVLTNVETRAPGRDRARIRLASMEPRPHERGNLIRTYRGAIPEAASMEPRPHERGNATSADPRACAESRLQWSHVLTNVETKPEWEQQLNLYAASMEPRPHERGNRPRPLGSRRK